MGAFDNHHCEVAPCHAMPQRPPRKARPHTLDELPQGQIAQCNPTLQIDSRSQDMLVQVLACHKPPQSQVVFLPRFNHLVERPESVPRSSQMAWGEKGQVLPQRNGLGPGVQDEQTVRDRSRMMIWVY